MKFKVFKEEQEETIEKKVEIHRVKLQDSIEANKENFNPKPNDFSKKTKPKSSRPPLRDISHLYHSRYSVVKSFLRLEKGFCYF
jgi:hypothetical protein